MCFACPPGMKFNCVMVGMRATDICLRNNNDFDNSEDF